jgi:regulator of replication initiation timing
LTDKILLGYEVGSGEPVFVPLHHLAIFGMTQLSGKTTTLEGLISRSGLRAIAFITKRGEAGFTRYNLVAPYYKPRADWQFVEGLVNVALGEKVKYEPGMRYGIMKVCKGHKDLKEIQKAALEFARDSKREFMKAVYEKLAAYLEIVIPELDKWVFTDKLDLSEGINVMDLSGMRLETQHLVIASTIEYAFANLDHVIVIIPEAWETIPQSKMTPVKWVAQQFIRKGAALGNYLWLDSQDIGGIDKTPLRQCDNWLMGRMKEAHEVERILKQLLGMKVAAAEIQTLPLGHFYAAIGNDVRKVYVLPVGVPESVGVMVARGIRTPESVRDDFLKRKMEVDETVWKEKYEKLQTEFETRVREEKDKAYKDAIQKVEAIKKTYSNVEELRETIAKLKDENVVLQKDKDEFQRQLTDLLEARLSIMDGWKKLFAWDDQEQTLLPSSNIVGLQVATTIVDVPSIEKFVTINTENVAGKILAVAKKGKLDGWRQLGEIVKAIEEERWTVTSQQVNNALNDLVKEGLIAKRHTDRNYFCLANGVRFAKEDK